MIHVVLSQDGHVPRSPLTEVGGMNAEQSTSWQYVRFLVPSSTACASNFFARSVGRKNLAKD